MRAGHGWVAARVGWCQAGQLGLGSAGLCVMYVGAATSDGTTSVNINAATLESDHMFVHDVVQHSPSVGLFTIIG